VDNPQFQSQKNVKTPLGGIAPAGPTRRFAPAGIPHDASALPRTFFSAALGI